MPYKSVKFTRTPGGAYVCQDWTIEKTEGEFRCPGYTWTAHSPAVGAGENFFGSLREAKQDVTKKIALCLR